VKIVALVMGMILVTIVLLALLQAPISQPRDFRNEKPQSNGLAKSPEETSSER